MRHPRTTAAVFTPGERRLIEHLAHGGTVPDFAAAANISPKMANLHAKNVYTKLRIDKPQGNPGLIIAECYQLIPRPEYSAQLVTPRVVTRPSRKQRRTLALVVRVNKSNPGLATVLLPSGSRLQCVSISTAGGMRPEQGSFVWFFHRFRRAKYALSFVAMRDGSGIDWQAVAEQLLNIQANLPGYGAVSSEAVIAALKE